MGPAEPSTPAHWGRLDLEGALSWLAAHNPGLPLLLLGHSIGGQLLGLAPTATALRGALLVSAQSGYWRNWEGGAQLRVWLSWHLLLPGVRLHARLRAHAGARDGENLPAGVARQWARWGRHPEHLFSQCSEGERERYLQLGFPIRCYRFTDDNFAPRMAVEQLVGFYRGAATEVITHAPGGVWRVGNRTLRMVETALPGHPVARNGGLAALPRRRGVHSA